MRSNENDERALRLMEALSAVDESLLERCESQGQESKKTLGKKLYNGKIFGMPMWKIGSAVAAVLCLAVVGVALQSGIRMNDAATESNMEGIAYTADTTSGYFGLADGSGAMEAESQDPSPAISGENVKETDNFEKTEAMVSTEATAVDEEDANDVVAESKQEEAENGLLDWLNSLVEKRVQDNMESMKADTATGLPLAAGIEISEEEMYEVTVVGAYVPTVLPEGYSFESAYLSKEGEPASLTVGWSRGMDFIMLHIEKPGTVPETVCAYADFSLEFVEKRMISRGGDQGDTDTPRGNFAVLYPDGIVVNFNGRGTAEEIWEMFCSMGISEND